MKLNELRKYFEGIDWSMYKTDYNNSDLGILPNVDRSPETAPYNDRNLAKRAKIGASFDGLNVLPKSRAQDIEQIMALLIMRGSINPDNLEGTVVDFGMGTGPGAYVLRQYGGNITGVDSSENSVQIAIEEGILPKERALVQDGFEYLRSLQPQSLNLVAAFMMHGGFPEEKLYNESQRVLKSGGQLLVTGGLVELKDELQRTVGRYGKVEDVITIHGDRTLGNVAFTYTKE